MKFFRVPFQSNDDDSNADPRANRLYQYIQSQSPQDMARLASEINPEVRQIISSNVQALLGYLPSQEFSTTVMSSKENLQNLLASAMLTGYFVKTMENRMGIESLFEQSTAEAELENENVIAQPSPDASLEQADFETEDFSTAPAEANAELPPLEEAPADFQLSDPRELFGGLGSAGLPGQSARERFERWAAEKLGSDAISSGSLGRFLAGDESPLNRNKRRRNASDDPEKLDIQVEINTRMDKGELFELLRGLREVQQPEKLKPSSEPESEDNGLGFDFDI